MRLSVATELGDVKCMQVDKDIDIAGLKALISADFGVPPPEQQILFNGAPLNQEKTLAQNGVGNDDILLLRRNAPAAATAGGATGQAEMVRLQILNNPALRQQITSQNPLLAQALSNPEQFGRIFQEMQRHLQSNPNQMSHDSSDPMDVQAQQRIEEEIKQRNIAMNMESAMEHHPESFGRVIMLYVNTEVNGHKVKAFVDSGAQATIMSPDCAQKCNIMHLLDKRFAGEARGVGVAKILGRVHSAQIKVGNQFLHCSFTVMEVISSNQGKGC